MLLINMDCSLFFVVKGTLPGILLVMFGILGVLSVIVKVLELNVSQCPELVSLVLIGTLIQFKSIKYFFFFFNYKKEQTFKLERIIYIIL